GPDGPLSQRTASGTRGNEGCADTRLSVAYCSPRRSRSGAPRWAQGRYGDLGLQCRRQLRRDPPVRHRTEDQTLPLCLRTAGADRRPRGNKDTDRRAARYNAERIVGPRQNILMKTNPVKAKLRAGQPSFGTWLSLGNLFATRVLARMGFDWLT